MQLALSDRLQAAFSRVVLVPAQDNPLIGARANRVALVVANNGTVKPLELYCGQSGPGRGVIIVPIGQTYQILYKDLGVVVWDSWTALDNGTASTIGLIDVFIR